MVANVRARVFVCAWTSQFFFGARHSHCHARIAVRVYRPASDKRPALPPDPRQPPVADGKKNTNYLSLSRARPRRTARLPSDHVFLRFPTARKAQYSQYTQKEKSHLARRRMSGHVQIIVTIELLAADCSRLRLALKLSSTNSFLPTKCVYPNQL